MFQSSGSSFLSGAALLACLLLPACSTAAQQTRSPAPGDVVATVGPAAITLSEVDEQAMRQPAGDFGGERLSQALYDARRAVLDELIAARLIDEDAKGRHIDRAAAIAQEVTAKVAQPTDDDVAAWYRANPERVHGAALDQVRAPIRQLLFEQRTEAARDAYIDRLKARTTIKILLDPPRQTIKAEAYSPTQGPSGAPVELVEFSDFQCPFCYRAHGTVKQVLDTYGSRVHFVYRHFPLPGHPNARPAAEASACAAEQGKFWPFYDRLFADQSKLGVADLKQSAADLGLDAARFNACVDEHKYKAEVDTDVAAGTEAGVSGTPAFFINGRMLSGAQPFSAFKRLIDEELSRH